MEDEEEEEEKKNLKPVNEENSGRARPRYPGAPEFRRSLEEEPSSTNKLIRTVQYIYNRQSITTIFTADLTSITTMPRLTVTL